MLSKLRSGEQGPAEERRQTASLILYCAFMNVSTAVVAVAAGTAKCLPPASGRLSESIRCVRAVAHMHTGEGLTALQTASSVEVRVD